MKFTTVAYISLAVIASLYVTIMLRSWYLHSALPSDPVKLKLPQFPVDSKIAIQTYVDRSKIPGKVGDAWDMFAPEYTRYVFDDADIRAMLQSHFPPIVLEEFEKIQNGAHKADLFRYCALYLFGGLYMDIKTELTKPLRDIFTDPQKMYVVISDISPGTIYNGIIYTPPGNPIMYDLILQAVRSNKDKLAKDYFLFIRYMHDLIRDKYLLNGKFQDGVNKTIGTAPDIYVLKETAYSKEECGNAMDRYKLCSWIRDHSAMVIKTRYPDYPWH